MKRWERAAVFGVAALLFATTGNVGSAGSVPVFAQQTTAGQTTVQTASQQGVLQYLYLEEQIELPKEDQKILVQLVPRTQMPQTAQLKYHIVETGEVKTIDAVQIQENMFLFAPEPKTDRQKQLLELTLQPQTIVLDSVTWTEGDTRYRFDFAKLAQEISYTTAKQETEDTSVLYTNNGQSVLIPVEEETKDTATDDMTRIVQRIEAAVSTQGTEQEETEQKPEQETESETTQTPENEQQNAETTQPTEEPTEDQQDTQTSENPTNSENSTIAVQDEITYTGGELFADVKSSNWFYPSVSYVMNKGLMTGMMDGNFAPSGMVNRAQFAVILYRMEGAPAVDAVSAYTDVPNDAFYTKAMLWAEQEGLLSGVDATTMQPQAEITREQMVSVLYRYAQNKGFDTSKKADLSVYADGTQVSDFAKEAMAWAVGTGLISGEGEQKLLRPQDATNRAVCAAMITHFCETYLPNTYPNIPIYATVETITIGAADPNTGDFNITVSDMNTTMEVVQVEAVLYCEGHPQDRVLRVMQKQDADTYTATDSVKNHKMQYGTYQVQVYVTLSNGIRILAGTQSAQITGSEAQMRISKNINAVYDEVGTDLYACYQWVAQNVSYKKLPIPLEPPAGYTADQWYAIQAFEQRQGNCFCYAGAFYHLAKALGYDVRYVEGKVAMAAGGNGPHGWVEITIDGATYICDPDMQREAPRHNFYMQPVGSPVIQYIR